MTWNYRIIHFDMGEHPYFGVCEVFYDNDGNPELYGEPEKVYGDTPEETVEQLVMMLKDVTRPDRPVLKESELQPALEATAAKWEAMLDDPTHWRTFDSVDEMFAAFDEETNDESLDNSPDPSL